MKEKDIETILKQNPQTVQLDTTFTAETLHKIALERNANTTHKKENILTKLFTMPKFATATLGVSALIITGGATYAAVNWFNADVATKQKADTVYSVASQCPASLVQNGKQTNTSKYQILKPQLISEHDLQLDELSTCEERAVTSSLRAAMPEIYQAGDSRDGLYYPVGLYGTVVSATADTITVANIPLDHETAPREHITTTLHINNRTILTDKGQKADTSAFKQGDSVYFIFQNSVRSNQNDHDWRATPSAQSTVRAIAKTQYDVTAIKEKVAKAAQEDAFRVLEKSDAYGG